MKILSWSLLVLVMMCQSVLAQFQEGKDYQKAPKDIVENKLVQELSKDQPSKVQVMEFFSYGCHWCFQLDPFIEQFRKTLSPDVEFQRIPVEFQPAWHALGKAYYAANDLNALPQIHQPLFEAIQTEKLTSATPEALRAFFTSRGVNAKDFDNTFGSFDIERKQKWALAIAKAFRITAIPVVVVHGPAGTYVTSVKMAGTENNMLKVLDHLVKMQNTATKSSTKQAVETKAQQPLLNKK